VPIVGGIVFPEPGFDPRSALRAWDGGLFGVGASRQIGPRWSSL
jgi:hypothetical protein